MCNNSLFNCNTISPMQESMTFLYRVAAEKRDVKTPAAVGRVMGVSQQRLKNWEGRGISKECALIAQDLFGIDSNALLKLNSTAEQSKFVYEDAETAQPAPLPARDFQISHNPFGWPFKTINPSQWGALSPTQKAAVETVAASYISTVDPPSHTDLPAQNAAAA